MTNIKNISLEIKEFIKYGSLPTVLFLFGYIAAFAPSWKWKAAVCLMAGWLIFFIMLLLHDRKEAKPSHELYPSYGRAQEED